MEISLVVQGEGERRLGVETKNRKALDTNLLYPTNFF